MGAAQRGTASKKRHGRGWRRARDRGAAGWRQRKATSTTYCRGALTGGVEGARRGPPADGTRA